MTSQIERVIANGKPLAVIQKLITEELLRLDRAKFEAELIAEYDELFPAYRDMTEDEIVAYDTENFSEDNPKPEEFIYPQVEIDYSEDGTYKTLEEYKNETRVITEAVEATYDEDGMVLTEAIPEVTEFVRPYTPIEVTDDMIQSELAKLSYVSKEKQDALKYLEETDWIVTKIAEAQALGTDISELLTKYSVELSQREVSRTTINQIEGNS